MKSVYTLEYIRAQSGAAQVYTEREFAHSAAQRTGRKVGARSPSMPASRVNTCSHLRKLDSKQAESVQRIVREGIRACSPSGDL